MSQSKYPFHFSRKLAASLALGAAFLGGKSALATITVHDLSQTLSTGVFSYSIALDDAGNIQPGDGFVIYDFPGYEGFLLTGMLSAGEFNVSQSLASNSLTSASAVDSNGNVAALSNGIAFDNGAVDNLSFVYVGPPNPDLGPGGATLTIQSSVVGGMQNSVYSSVDHSGPNVSVPLSFSANPVLVPSSVPEPASIGLIAAGSLLAMRRRQRRI